MLAHLDIPFVDTDPRRLALSLDTGQLPALSQLTAQLGGMTVTLALLGASHQVRVSTADTAHVLTETLACLPGREPYLPARQDHSQHSFISRVDTHDGRGFAEAVARILSDASDAPHGIVGHYPGRPDAVTAVIAEATDAGIAWDSWHTYPQHHQIVVTRSQFTIAPDFTGGNR
ncbi:DUF2617 family protein [Williamsia sp. CHRR-6]|uniref:DUF2617 family protein n=1 Tax=Williamsia sp. CHRR-6 TaxID=2835871 RepID=UPI001BDAEB44|nr:DUF2617 family protein [Williamsia sp. CHRR-6]MBT0567002.1 DUF2617 family protein [Williamsia sp. CHRR-6]